MKLEISGFRIQVTKEIDSFIEKKIKKLDKYFKEIISAHVILKEEKSGYKTEIHISVKGMAFYGEQVAPDLHTSIDRAIDKVVGQSRKYKEKLKSHKQSRKIRKAKELLGTVESDLPENRSSTIKIFSEIATPMKVEHACAQLNSSSNNFLVFRNIETNQVNVVYKKESGNIGLVQPE